MQPIFPKECKGPDCKGPQPIYYEERRDFKLAQPPQPVRKYCHERLIKPTHPF
jgi:hypothetical protein